MIRTALQSTQCNLKPEVVHSQHSATGQVWTQKDSSAHMRFGLHRALSWQQWSLPPRPAEHSHLRSHPPCKPRDHAVPRGHCVADPARPVPLGGERGARVRAARPRAVRVPCTYRASKSSRGPPGGLSRSLDKVLLGLLHRKFHRHLGRLIHRTELGCIGDGGAQRGLERRAARRRVCALVDALLRWE